MTKSQNFNAEIGTMLFVMIALPAVIFVKLLPALLAGLLVHELVHMLAPRMFGGRHPGRAKITALSLLLAVIVIAIGGAVTALILFLRSDAGNLPMLFEKLAEILEKTREILPISLQEWVPDHTADLKDQIVEWLRGHATEVQTTGGALGHSLVVALIGMVIGALISLREARSSKAHGLLVRALNQRMAKLAEAFRRIVFAQVRISALNTALTALYLAVALPLASVHLPLTKTMIVITFLVGLLPVLGNLISNTIIVIISLSYSLPIALCSLAFLVLVHKLEYFVNARIVGSQIHAAAWELLMAMLVMESFFGLAGVVAAPIYYAYFKSEMTGRGWI